MPKIYRTMIKDGDVPAIGNGRDMLGVRPVDIQADNNVDSTVHPRTGGMSVNICLCMMKDFLIPARIGRGGRAKDDRFIWRTGEGRFARSKVADRLMLGPDRDSTSGHGCVEPDRSMPLAEYEIALAATQDMWEIDENANEECPFCKQPGVQ